jgi:hypothetical protein
MAALCCLPQKRHEMIWEILMRITASVAVVAIPLALTGILPAHAVGTQHPFCIQGDAYPGLSNCTFDTYEQCKATASGRNLSCIANPYFAGQTDDPYATQNRNRPFPQNYYPAQPGYYPRSRY